ncbi:MAG: response regulator, partial [Desulfobaccales bacterium]|nr:response regulator [Desulfobaccales bacterium]
MTDKGNLILLVDDEPDMCWALEHLLHNQGFVTRTALSAREALNLMEQHHFGRAFLDAKLPDMDGLELAR